MDTSIISQLLLATFLGALIGIEREMKKREAGLQTYSLVTLGTCFFTIISFELFKSLSGMAGAIFDPLQIIPAIAIGIGFIGAGAISRRDSKVTGLTTAAGLWTAAAIGIAVGAGLYYLAVITTFLTLVILAGFGILEEKVLKTK